MDPVRKMWMYNNWIADQNDDAELAKNHAYLVASFYNPEAVQKVLGSEKHTSTDEEFEESSRMVKEMSFKLTQNTEEPPKRKRRRPTLTQG